MRVDRPAPNDSSPPLGDGIPGCAHLVIGGLMPSLKRLLQAVLVGLDHLLDHLAAHRAGLLAGQIAVVALLQGDAHLPWCSFSISKGFEAKFLVTVRQNRHAEFGSSSKFLLCFKMEGQRPF